MTTEQVYLIDDYVTVRPGEPFRLFPIGRLVKDGNIKELTKELLSRFKLPHFKPPIKLGGHEDETPAGGHIAGLEVRDDGLWAVPEYTDKGNKAVEEGDYKYQSPEVIWEGGFEDPDTGELIEGPLIVGAALLHMPHMGANAALYSVDPISNGGVTMSESVTAPNDTWYQSVIEKLMGRVNEPIPSEPLEANPVEISGVEPEKFDALEKERDDLQAKLQTMETEAQYGERIAHFAAEFKDTVLDDNTELHELIAGIRDEATAEALLVQFKALSGQIVESNLTADIGSGGELDDLPPAEALNTAVLAKMEEAKVDYNTAMNLIRDEQPDLFTPYIEGG